MAEYWRDRKVLITGHEGFLGSNLARRLVERGAKVTGVDKVAGRSLSVLNGIRKKIVSVKTDIADFDSVKKIIRSRKPEVVFHLAAEAIVERAKADPLNVFRSNIQGAWNVLEACRAYRIGQSIVVASSDKAYGASDELPYLEDTPLKGLHPYDASKSCEDILAQAYYHSYKLPVAVVRCGNIYGPGDFNFSRLIPDAIRSALKADRLVIRSDGTFTRDYVYVDDVVDGYTLLAEHMKKKRLYGEAFNLSNERPYSVDEVFRKIASMVDGKFKKPRVLDRAKDEIHDQYLSSGKARGAFGWKPRHSFEEGLAATIAWYRCRL